MVSGLEPVCAAPGGETQTTLPRYHQWYLSLSLLFYQYGCGKVTVCSLLNLGRQILHHLKLVFPGSQHCLTAFWLPPSLPKRRGSQQWSHLIPLKPLCYSQETAPERSSVPGAGMSTAQFQRLILFVKWSVTWEQDILSDMAKNKVGLSKVKWCKLGTICIKHPDGFMRSCRTESFGNLYKCFHLEMRICAWM